MRTPTDHRRTSWRTTVGLLGVAVIGVVAAAGFAGLVTTQRATGAAPDQDGDTIPDAIECPAITSGSLVNGDFEAPLVPEGQVVFIDQAAVPGWDSTDPRGRIQLWASALGTTPFEGRQDAELNTDRVADLSQDVATTPGETMAWSLQHRGRSGRDTMRVRIGAPGATGAIASPDLVADQTAWVAAAGRITVPAGQTTSRITLQSVSHAGEPPEGNFVDDVVFAPVDRDTDLDGTADCDDADSDDDGIPDAVEAGPDPAHPIDSDGNGLPDYRQPAVRATVDAVDDTIALDDGATLDLDVRSNDQVPDGAAYVLVRQPAHGIASLTTNGLLTVSGAPSYGGPDTVLYQVCVGTVCDSATVAITVTLVNDAPSAGDDLMYDVIAEGQQVDIRVLDNDTDRDGRLDVATLRIVTPPTYGSVQVAGDHLVYTMPRSVGPTDHLVYEICDDGAPRACAQAGVRIEPAPPPDVVSVTIP